MQYGIIALVYLTEFVDVLVAVAEVNLGFLAFIILDRIGEITVGNE